MRKVLGLTILAIALLIPSRAAAALSVIQHAGAQSLARENGVPSANIAPVFGSSITAGSSIFAACIIDDNSTTVATPTDTRGNTYTQAFSTGTGGGASWGNGIAVSWTATGSTGGADTITIGLSPSGYGVCFSIEIGTASSVIVDKTASQVTPPNTFTYDSGATTTTTAANELIIGFGGTVNQPGNFTQGTGFTLDVSQNGGNWESGYLEHKSVSSTGTYNAVATSDTQTSNGDAVVVTLKESSPAQKTPPAVYLSKNIFSRLLLFLDSYSPES